MDLIKKLWPTPFKIKKGDVASLIVQLIIFIVIVAIAGAILGLLTALPLIGWIASIAGSLLGLYGTVGVVLCFLQFFDVLKG